MKTVCRGCLLVWREHSLAGYKPGREGSLLYFTRPRRRGTHLNRSSGVRAAIRSGRWSSAETAGASDPADSFTELGFIRRSGDAQRSQSLNQWPGRYRMVLAQPAAVSGTTDFTGCIAGGVHLVKGLHVVADSAYRRSPLVSSLKAGFVPRPRVHLRRLVSCLPAGAPG